MCYFPGLSPSSTRFVVTLDGLGDKYKYVDEEDNGREGEGDREGGEEEDVELLSEEGEEEGGCVNPQCLH